MKLGWLEDVLLLIEEGSLSRAAARRHVTQPAFSRRIRAFEDWIGRALLERGTNRVELAANLRRNEHEIRILVERAADLRRRLVRTDETTQTVTIAAQHALAVSTFPDICSAAQAIGWGVSWRLRTLNRADGISMFLRGDAQILLCYESEFLPPMPFDATIRRMRWDRDALVPIIASAAPDGAANDGLPPDRPHAAYPPYIAYPIDSHFGELLRRAEARGAVPPASRAPICETALTFAVKEMILRSVGYGWLPLTTCRDELRDNRLASLERSQGRVPLEIALFTRESHEVTLRLEALYAARNRPALRGRPTDNRQKGTGGAGAGSA